MFQFRLPNGPTTAYYSPGRDVAHVGFVLIQDGLDYLNYLKENKTDALREYVIHNKITDAEIDAAIQDFIDSVEQEIKNPDEGMLSSNQFTRNRPCVRYLVYACIAPLFIGASIKGKKDVLARADIVEYSGEEFHRKFTGLSNKFRVHSPTLWDTVKNRTCRFYERLKVWVGKLGFVFP